MFALYPGELVVMMAGMWVFLFALVMLGSWPSPASNAAAERQVRNRDAPHLYRRYCVSCHGMDGTAKTSKGKFSHARDLTDPQWQADVSDERIFNSIMNGRNVRGNMPAFAAKLKEREVNSLVGFVRRLKPGQQ